MEKINIAELLKDCPSGMELDCLMFENVYFDKVSDDKKACYPILCYITDEKGNRSSISFTKNGCESIRYGAKCVIFPKGKTTWEGFQRPFKDGDVIFTHANCLKVGLGNTWISIYKEKRNGGVATYVDYAEDGSDYYSDIDGDKAFLCMEKDILRQRFATEEEQHKLFKAIKDNGYRWNPETKTIEKSVEPKFKVGDVIQDIDTYKVKITEVNIEDECYGYESMIAKGIGSISFSEQDNWELVPSKFDINTLKPFESKVLVRDYDDRMWNPAFWGKYLEDSKYSYLTSGGCYKQCIPYEGNEHLLGTTDNCDNFYKTWE